MGPHRGFCSTLEEAGLDIGPCCESCHEDHTGFGYDLLDVDLPGGGWVSVCCRVYEDIFGTDRAAIEAALDKGSVGK